MTSVTCAYCGLPFKVTRVVPGRPSYCCTGCAVASRVPVDSKGDFPVNAALVSAVATGFVFFNQLLFWALAVLLMREGKVDAAANSALVSVVAGAITWLVLTISLFRNAVGRWQDTVVVVACLALGVIGARWGSLGCAAAANALLLAWSLRGLLKQKTPPKPDVTV